MSHDFSSIPDRLQSGDATLAVVGLGYVGLPLAVAFGRKVPVVGFDVSEAKVESLRNGTDPTGELGPDELASARIDYTTNPGDLRRASFVVVAVPTPIDRHKKPDLGPIVAASRAIGQNLTPGAVVVYESTVYPGVTEEVCVPVLERESGLRCGTDFRVGYSPERINPGDKEHTLERIVKVVAGQDAATLEVVARVYELVVEAGVHRAPTIRTAEAAKVIENTQRDLNIALMNELSVIFNRMGIDTRAVLEAAGTKWNFLRFTPGLVGGHCIGVDPYYLTYKAEELGYKPQVILAGRAINDGMGKYVAENTVKGLIRCGKVVQGSRVLVLGLTFKENVSDLRNSRVKDVIRELQEYGVEVLAHDPLADPGEAEREFGLRPVSLDEAAPVDGIVAAVGHDAYRDLTLDRLKGFYRRNGRGVLADVKMRYDRAEAETLGFYYWSL
ncbi:MAG: nucleotide sugar dehydrogenase [Deltaproteobacteria bacterium]|nr:nucleotide sugar dehydrogenase [Deltaproteobacteria bacterium]